MIINLVILSGILSLIYGYWAGNSVLKSSAGNEKMQEIPFLKAVRVMKKCRRFH